MFWVQARTLEPAEEAIQSLFSEILASSEDYMNARAKSTFRGTRNLSLFKNTDPSQAQDDKGKCIFLHKTPAKCFKLCAFRLQLFLKLTTYHLKLHKPDPNPSIPPHTPDL
jgi:hypothetical protein